MSPNLMKTKKVKTIFKIKNFKLILAFESYDQVQITQH